MKATRPMKRRKLMTAQTLCSSLQKTGSQSQPSKGFAIATVSPTCTSCHRSLNTAQGRPIICSRCSSPTCTICSRTCTASPLSSSVPPTPHLTRSPTPATTPPQSPRRSALTLHSANTNYGDLQRTTVAVIPNTGKRRKGIEEDYLDSGSSEQSSGDHDLVPGCGRIMCRNCCFENSQSNTTTCYDCYGGC
ncbi:hypothetical protein BDZ94DRAFT_1250768 [Collybia nuda]|uniref:Uncharacterized protein n=1 Tax=Collybia nuda TaxID=64659 RepID=A0A9P5YDR6_9AGAR|nr:hypothetical protein BDZ94DRAFT_1250768 [Collybia nuda]